MNAESKPVLHRRFSLRRLPLVLLALALVILVAGSVTAVGGRPLSTTLSGAEEAPGPGDPDGSGAFHMTLNQGQGELCYELTAEDIAPATAAHIHIAPVGQPGPIVVPLEPPTNGSSSGCVSVDRNLIKAIRQNPEAYYVNVHNAPFPPGAIRSQLGK